MRGGSIGLGGGGDLNIISRWGEVNVNFRLVRGGMRLNFEPYSTHFPIPPPFQVIIAQSLTYASYRAFAIDPCWTFNHKSHFIVPNSLQLTILSPEVPKDYSDWSSLRDPYGSLKMALIKYEKSFVQRAIWNKTKDIFGSLHSIQSHPQSR